MGLDMALYATESILGNEYTRNADGSFAEWEDTNYDTAIGSVGLDRSDISVDTPYVSLEIKVAEWRKANAIHQWFVNNIQGGEDNCRDYYVSRDDLIELRDRCREVIDMRDRQNANPDEMLPTAEDILPTGEGFFFGSTEYDEWYYQNIQYTLDTLDNLLTNPKFGGFDFSYSSSW